MFYALLFFRPISIILHCRHVVWVCLFAGLMLTPLLSVRAGDDLLDPNAASSPQRFYRISLSLQ